MTRDPADLAPGQWAQDGPGRWRVGLKPCGCWPSDACDCAQQSADATTALTNPIPHPVWLPTAGGAR
jgi:hypothetical protein